MPRYVSRPARRDVSVPDHATGPDPFLTVLGIVIGISSVIVMVSIGQGTKTSIESSIQSIGSNLLIGGRQAASSSRRIGGEGAGANTDSLTIEDAEAP